jgi:hypothetical protein
MEMRTILVHVLRDFRFEQTAEDKALTPELRRRLAVNRATVGPCDMTATPSVRGDGLVAYDQGLFMTVVPRR